MPETEFPDDLPTDPAEWPLPETTVVLSKHETKLFRTAARYLHKELTAIEAQDIDREQWATAIRADAHIQAEHPLVRSDPTPIDDLVELEGQQWTGNIVQCEEALALLRHFRSALDDQGQLTDERAEQLDKLIGKFDDAHGELFEASDYGRVTTAYSNKYMVELFKQQGMSETEARENAANIDANLDVED